MIGAFQPARPCYARLEIYGESLGEPAGRVTIWKQPGMPTEHVLAESPDTARAIEMEYMCELVRYDELQPVIKRSEPPASSGGCA
jgi:hypothetical protein